MHVIENEMVIEPCVQGQFQRFEIIIPKLYRSGLGATNAILG